ncbi:helix-turn-helix domain-containing protein [Streptomyces sp. NPDC057413]|uniref:helix-turn-helix domain-containing protein n=1 Tax=Streptomyces sp. NPDC057413 TaxID=3346124 RepID=UPI0036935500
MTHEPERWAVLGRALRGDRERQGLTREELAARVRERGGEISARTIGNLESPRVIPKRGTKPPSLEPVAAALGWKTGWTDRILAGDDPADVLEGVQVAGPDDVTPQHRLLELLPGVYEFGRIAVLAGAPHEVRDDFEAAVQRLLNSAASPSRGAYGDYSLAAYRPHAPAEGVPADDAARIHEALRRDS